MYTYLSFAVGLLMSVQPLWAFAQQGQLDTTSNDQGILVTEGDRPVLFYQRATKSMDGQWPRAGYVHPLYGLEGQTLTEDFPKDHRHHRGIFWAWHQVRVGDKPIGDPWLCQDFQWDVVSTRITRQEQSIALHADVRWKSPLYVDNTGQPIPIVREQTTITAFQQEPSFRCIDFQISLLALVDDVWIGGSDDRKGYGGFSPRIELRPDQTFRSSAGKLQPTLGAMDVGPWVNISDNHWGITIISHVENPGSPQQWILRSKRSMQNPVYPGRTPVMLSTVASRTLRYRLVVNDGNLDNQTIEQLRNSFDAFQ